MYMPHDIHVSEAKAIRDTLIVKDPRGEKKHMKREKESSFPINFSHFTLSS